MIWCFHGSDCVECLLLGCDAMVKSKFFFCLIESHAIKHVRDWRYHWKPYQPLQYSRVVAEAVRQWLAIADALVQDQGKSFVRSFMARVERCRFALSNSVFLPIICPRTNEPDTTRAKRKKEKERLAVDRDVWSDMCNSCFSPTKITHGVRTWVDPWLWTLFRKDGSQISARWDLHYPVFQRVALSLCLLHYWDPTWWEIAWSKEISCNRYISSTFYEWCVAVCRNCVHWLVTL
jgi:hypothetical protein